MTEVSFSKSVFESRLVWEQRSCQRGFQDRRVFAAQRRILLHHNHPIFRQRVNLCFESGQTTLAAAR